jgi:hypothetical protein
MIRDISPACSGSLRALDVSQLPVDVHYVLLKGSTEVARHAWFVKQ